MASKNRTARAISAPSPPPNLKLRFSFEFYDTEGTKYCLSLGTADQIRAALGRLKEVNQNTLNELLAKGTTYHFHPVDWSQTKEKAGFPDRRLDALEPYQFALLAVNGQKTRIYGALYENTFFIVWVDWHHVITPSRKKGT